MDGPIRKDRFAWYRNSMFGRISMIYTHIKSLDRKYLTQSEILALDRILEEIDYLHRFKEAKWEILKKELYNEKI